MSDPPAVYLSAQEIRRRFNDGQYWERLLTGEFRSFLAKSVHANPQISGQPYCTRSEMVSYLDSQDNEIALVHQYLRPDGTVGGSGRPDPKRIFEGGVLYVYIGK
jgi:hypothetical protein